MSITILIIIATVLVSYLGFQNHEVIEKCKNYPYAEAQKGEYFRMLTGGFLHGDWVHCGVNMFVLWSFGSLVERYFSLYFGLGATLYLVFYLVAIVAADIPGYFKHQNNPYFSSVGASGAVSAITFASILFSPTSQILIYGILPVPAWVFGGVYLAYTSWAERNKSDNIDHSAHFGGAVFGFLAPIVLDFAINGSANHFLTGFFGKIMG
jgi:membrane associated rhomboid family serine protease